MVTMCTRLLFAVPSVCVSEVMLATVMELVGVSSKTTGRNALKSSFGLSSEDAVISNNVRTSFTSASRFSNVSPSD